MDQHLEHPPKPSTRKYVLVFISLVCLTVLTVALSYLKRSLEAAIAGAMTIATIKACLVGGYFMHLIKERPIIFWLLLLAFILLVAILALPVIGLLNDVRSHTVLFS